MLLIIIAKEALQASLFLFEVNAQWLLPHQVPLVLDAKLGILDGIHHRLDKGSQTVYAKSHWSTMRTIFPTRFWTDTF